MDPSPLSSESSNKSLTADSLYICTVPLMGGGRFHWLFTNIDSNGSVTYHQWAASTKDVRGPEDYLEDSKLPNGQVLLGFFKVTDYAALDLESFRKICRSVTPKSFPTAQENRLNNISCRIWVVDALAVLLKTRERALDIEKAIIQRSTMLDQEYLSLFIRGVKHRPVVEFV